MNADLAVLALFVAGLPVVNALAGAWWLALLGGYVYGSVSVSLLPLALAGREGGRAGGWFLFSAFAALTTLQLATGAVRTSRRFRKPARQRRLLPQ
ncbi:MAG: hypothetical protein ACYDCL_00230 [Myxococcales bacterium]